MYARMGLLYVGGPMKYIISLTKLVTLFVRLLWRTERLSSTFLFRTEISEALKFCLRGLREVVEENAMIVTRWSL